MQILKKRDGQLRAIMVAGAIFGQSYFSNHGAQAQPAVAAPAMNWSYIHHSSTALEGALRGEAEVIAAQGSYIYLSSLAGINNQEAQRRAIENRLAYVKAYCEERIQIKEYRDKYGPKPLVGEARKLAMAHYVPRRLSAQQLDPATGAIKWPYELNAPKFRGTKAAIEQQFSKRTTEESGWGSECEVEVTRLCKTLVKLLHENSTALTSDQKVFTRNFIDSVLHESQISLRSTQDMVAMDEGE